MQRFIAITFIMLSLLGISLWQHSQAQQPEVKPAPTPAEPKKLTHAEKNQFKILPLLVIKPGETKELLLTTWCTVDVTRGGGFKIGEMRGGNFPEYDKNDRLHKSYERAGVKVTVPDFATATKFSKDPAFAPLKQHDVNAFIVTVTASPEAQPGVMEMHLADDTCNGNCEVNFRVLVIVPEAVSAD